jgi:hypothetical protein
MHNLFRTKFHLFIYSGASNADETNKTSIGQKRENDFALSTPSTVRHHCC